MTTEASMTEQTEQTGQTEQLASSPTTHAGILAWVQEVAALTEPDRVLSLIHI